MIATVQTKTKKKPSRMARGILIIMGVLTGVVLISLVSVYASQSHSLQFNGPDGPVVWGSNEASMVASNNWFALSTYTGLRGNDEKNIFFSPFSISSALTMTMLGAKGRTAEQMFEVLHFDEGLSEEALHGGFKTLLKELLSKEEDHYIVHIANRVYMQEGFRVLDSFKDATKNYYDAESQNLDFQRDTETARNIVNEWVEDMTRDKIKELLKPGVLSSSTRTVLVNAIYFKGTWLHEFNPELTKEKTFHISDDATAKVDMMYHEGDFRNGFNEELNAQILELPYLGKNLSMVLVLPNEKNGLKAMQDKLTWDVTSLTRNLKLTDIHVNMPKFKMTCDFELGELLQLMGMKDLFTPIADLSGITGARDLYVSHVVHKAFVEVNEEGSEAAAATAVIMVESAAMVPNMFLADHPFYFFIKDDKTNSILFMGRYVQPETGSVSYEKDDL